MMPCLLQELKNDTVVHAYSPSYLETEAGGLLKHRSSGKSGLHGKIQRKKKTGNGKILLCPFQNSLSEEEVMMAPEHITQVPGSSLR
jgi:hypothetical protein